MSDEELEVAKANLLRDELKSYELEEDDIEILETDLDDYGSETYLPVLINTSPLSCQGKCLGKHTKNKGLHLKT